MSIANAFQTGITGLNAQSKKVSTISDNIANANTNGYKRGFSDLVTRTAGQSGNVTMPQGVRVEQGSEVSKQGGFSQTTSDTDLAIAGEGFFIVSKVPNDPVESNYMLTRAGSFKPDENGFLRNSAGLYLHGFAADPDGTFPASDRTSFADVAAVNVRDVEMVAAETTRMDVEGNLPAQASGLATPGAPFISTTDYYTPLGERERLTFNWQPTTNQDEWTLQIDDDNGAAMGQVTVTFNNSGPNAGSPASWSGVTNMAAAPSNFAFNTATGEATLTINNGTTPQTIVVGMGAPNSFTHMTQFDGDYEPLNVDKDGSSAGALDRTEIDEFGNVRGIFDNGLRRVLYQIPVGNVRNPDGLEIADGNAFKLSNKSGSFTILDANRGSAGKIVSGSLEQSNVDLAQELTDLIQTQRAYSSNAKIITTADEMLEETTRLKR